MKSKRKWKNNADSPVLLFIDDLCNKWIDLNGDGIIQTNEDWGYAGFNERGAFKYLQNEILTANPSIKTTFFVPVGSRASITSESNVKSISEPINKTENSRYFFQSLNSDPRFELAYHGTTHGVPAIDESEFIQEWDTYKSIDEAIQTINRGKTIYKDVFGIDPSGGKYCGYVSNQFSDQSIDLSGFVWWCRYYNRGAMDGSHTKTVHGDDSNPLTSFDIKYFGKKKVIDIPTTVSGDLLNFVFRSTGGIKGLIKKSFRALIIRYKLREIDFLIKNNLVISIQEHISPSREDMNNQTPNIYDDKESLRAILKYLKNKNVWYCTGSELAEWINKNK
jgi:hypothetical protein